MRASSILSLAVLVFSQLSPGNSEETAAKTSSNDAANTDTNSASLSRAKRGGYDMQRLGRGLHMLRLGKRDGGLSQEEMDNLDELYQELEANLQYPEYPYSFEGDEFGYPYSDEDMDIPEHPRFRRSTPSSDGVIAPEVLQQASSELKEPIGSDFGGEDIDSFYPEDEGYWYGDLEDLLQEGGEEDEKRSLGMLRLGKRQLGMLRLGKRPMSMLRLGKRPMSMLRLGKRPMSMLRLGKRPMSMLRLGKRPMSMLRLGKRPMSMLRLGKREQEDEDEKRSLGMLRLGKRSMSMLRLGKRQDENLDDVYNEEEKRSLGMLRLGKRPMSMLRLGKRPMSMLRLGKRPMSMLRLGKRPMSMLRLGKREQEDQEEKRSLGMLRLGKRSTE